MVNFRLNNPLPASMRSECKKCGRILASMVDPRQAFGPDKVIPPQILANAKGLAILTVFKAGFLGSGGVGSGIVVARLPDGRWSAPSAIGTFGGGFGGQIGFELTDFVFILNDSSAVKTFSQLGSITLGGNVSIAAGPVGRNAEAAGAASLKSLSGVFAYSKTKGLFAGISLEGKGFVERRDANEKLYGRPIKAASILRGDVEVPPAAEPLMRVLNTRVFSGGGGGYATDDAMYNDIPVYDEAQDDVVWQGRSGAAYGEGIRTQRTGEFAQSPTEQQRPSRASTWQDNVYDREPSSFGGGGGAGAGQRSRGSSLVGEDYVYSDRPRAAGPGRPSAPKPAFGAAAVNKTGGGALASNQAVAKFTFTPDQEGDLGFKKGEVITILKRTENDTDWWTGRIGTREGIFPSNYVETV